MVTPAALFDEGSCEELSCSRKIHDLLSESLELGSDEWFGHTVTPHEICWTVLCVNVLLVLLISDKKQSCVEVPGSFPSTLATIRLEFDGTFVVLHHNVWP